MSKAVPLRNPAPWPRSIGIFTVLIVAFALLPLVGTEYLFDAILTPFLALSLAALGLNILVGYAGQVSLGSSAFMAVGAYAAYNLILRLPAVPMYLISSLQASSQPRSASSSVFPVCV